MRMFGCSYTRDLFYNLTKNRASLAVVKNNKSVLTIITQKPVLTNDIISNSSVVLLVLSAKFSPKSVPPGTRTDRLLQLSELYRQNKHYISLPVRADTDFVLQQ